MLSLSQALDRLEEEKTLGVWDEFDTTTPWSTLNQRLGRWRPGNLITLSGPQGTGKTTFALNVVAHWAEKGYPAAQAVRRYALRLLAFDTLHMLARSIEHRTEEVGVLTKSFKFFAMEHQIPFVMIAQPRKLALGQVMTPWDLKDSSDIFSDSDQIILLHREMIGAQRENEAVAAAQRDAADNYSPLTLVRVAKGRHQASRDVLLFCEGAQHRFRDIAPSDIPKARPTTPAAHQRHPGHADG